MKLKAQREQLSYAQELDELRNQIIEMKIQQQKDSPRGEIITPE